MFFLNSKIFVFHNYGRLIIFRPNLHTIIIAQMLSTRGERHLHR